MGDVLNSFSIMVLGTVGRTTGAARHTPVEYRRHGSKVYVVSGWGETPQWYRNLRAQPRATVQLGSRTYAADAAPITDRAEAMRVLYLFRRTAPVVYDAVLARLSATEGLNARMIPDVADKFTIMRLDLLPDALPTCPPLAADLRWLPPAVLMGGLALAALRVLTQRQRA